MSRAATKLSAENVLVAFALRLDGRSLEDIATRLNVSVGHVWRIVTGQQRVDVEPNHPDRIACRRMEDRRAAMRQNRLHSLRATLLNLAAKDYVNGHSLASAAKRWGVSKTGLYEELVRAGIRRRSPNRKAKHGVRKEGK